MEQTHYLISDAARLVEVESHVLRYWEEELEIPIKRNELGHRYYTGEDVERFREIKMLKEQGLQLKAIRMVLKDGKLERIGSSGKAEGGRENGMIEIVGEREPADACLESREEKGMRLRILLQHMIGDAVRENNRELCEEIKECVLKELDYQFRQWGEQEEEREAERRKREEEHYRHIDEVIRSYSRKTKTKEKKPSLSPFKKRKKPSTA